ncbi:hypothetical protein [Cerasicoccus fimbriatus]|uniref:[protein-PII] uridylyltransferase family protein n=1 Tax=Cerasicoccus fimbriatus TaxID=3014554 RepID=UPI0022B51D8D|nr:hypothetical protein [Cerasicoccus sp. TK19100]
MSVENRVRRLGDASPFYAQQLRLHPDWIDWLDKPKNRDYPYRYASLEDLWRRRFCPDGFSLAALRQFRRRMSLRIAYRELNGLADVETSWRELSMLAEFVVRRLCEWRFAEWLHRFGEPWCDAEDQRAGYCIFALGKLGAGELNFCSDLDLIFCKAGSGHCRKNGRPTGVTTREFYASFFRQIAADMTAPNEDGVLYHIDLRLRPEGDSGPVVRTASSLVNYYWTAGQTWERLAWLRARPIAGDLALGHGVMEEINPFRYPRFPPNNLMNEVAGVKLRTEKEVPADELARDIKSGPGGIREVEFIVQALQLIHGGKNPFLQTNSTVKAIQKLARYEVLPLDDACFLDHAYRWLRKLENRLQMRGETPRHCLPSNAEEQRWLFGAMDYEDWDTFAADMEHWRAGIRARYVARFPADPQEERIQAWTTFLAGQAPEPSLRADLERWFPDSDEVEARLRKFVLGDSPGLITRDAVLRFLDLAHHFDRTLPRLARPMLTLERIGRFAEHYGARRHFFRDSANPTLFEILSLLFDRSQFIHELLCRHPGIMEELLHEAPKRLKTRRDCRDEIQLLAPGEDGFAQRLWLYVKAEQVRMAIGELLHGLSLEAVGWALSQLAEAVVCETMALAQVEAFTVVALGKLGAEELTLGSDLDLMLIAPEPLDDDSSARLRDWCALLMHNGGLGPMFVVDLRLRPHGEAGPLAVTLPALRDYHASTAKAWEKQILVRSRPIAGPEAVQAAFVAWRDEMLYQKPMTAAEVGELWRMRQKIEQEKPASQPPAQRAFKTGAGGLLDLEFLTEALAMTHGPSNMELRQPHARTCLLAAGTKGLFPQKLADELNENWNKLRQIEFSLRRQSFQPIIELPDDLTIRRTLARWHDFCDIEAFWREFSQMLATNRRALEDWLRESLPPEPASAPPATEVI